MNIGIVCYPTYGGSGVIATELGMALARRGWKVHFITYALPSRLDRFQQNVNFHEVEIPSYPLMEHQLYTLALASKIIDTTRFEQLDVLHVHYAIPHAISGYLAKQVLHTEGISLRVITTLHGTDITLVGLDPGFHPLVKFSIEASDAVTCVSNYLRDRTTQLFTDRSPIEVIPNFVDTTVYDRTAYPSASIRKQLVGDAALVLMHISNFRPVKRVTDTIRILAAVREHGIDAYLVLVGDGPDRAEAEHLCRTLNLCDAVRFVGKVVATAELLSAADIFLLPSQNESFGLAALEAMSCGVPVVASNVGGIPEVVTHGHNGYLAEPGDIKRMARYCIELATNPKKWQRFSSAARTAAVERFSVEHVVPQYEQLYRRLLHA
ncbi:MAG: N-acetyl-alpha-D-glucosaminyl L-malate synthase BshA [Bacteroidota bacterium]|nr:N-acetyl-alpha-D-glucosaminyl L-malate synthase BshA [Candidatus Kapabacteria bacterium]MCX7936616.1 N-acetyl-alpha-D-glucosaminyl L-malate synthase BshA [Chlorobiota bacterium]MDW8074809.1 N-acetyl-alpha-D-glucosaminyl L-malate synthase BshA [Bacteroidota bacterium]MDW8271448.1 N-acetyl-alpha-D-glucosaminyl L-malate synthase BshA [Bacteroidota bacterium]